MQDSHMPATTVNIDHIRFISEARRKWIASLSEDLQRYLHEDGTLSAYVWPGGYPLYYLDNEHNVLCPACASKIDTSTTPVAADINYEDAALYCDDCYKRIPSAYAEPEE